MRNTWVGIGALVLGLGVILGAFGAHGLKDSFDSYTVDIWRKAVLYQYVHGLGILITAILAQTKIITEKTAAKTCLIFFVGVVVFSGSLYALALSGVKVLGAITPIGGTLFIIGWLLLSYQTFSGKSG